LLITLFQFVCDTWTDNPDQLPLQYAFALIPISGASRRVLLTEFQYARDIKVKLPGGNRIIIAYIRDALGAIAEFPFTVDVQVPDYASYGGPVNYADQFVTESLDKALAIGDFDAVGQTLVLTSDLLQTTRTSLILSDSERGDRANLRSRLFDGLQAITKTSKEDLSRIDRNLQLSTEVCTSPDECTSSFRVDTLDYAQNYLDKAVQMVQNPTPSSGFITIPSRITDNVLNQIDNIGTSIRIDQNTTSTNINQTYTSTQQETQRYAGTYESIVNSLASGVLYSAEVGERVLVTTPNINVVFQKTGTTGFNQTIMADPNATDNNTVASVDIPPSVSSNSGLIFIHGPDIYTYGYYGSNYPVLNRTVSVTLFDGQQERDVYGLQLNQLIRIKIPGSIGNDSLIPGCVFFNRTHGWDGAGCKRDIDGSCLCNHLTTFNVQYFTPRVNPISINDFLALTPENILNHPASLIGILVVIGAYLIILPFAIRRDYQDAEISVRVSYITKWKENVRQEAGLNRSFTKRTIDLFQTEHLWFSIYARKFGDDFSSVERLTLLLIIVLLEMMINAIFYGRQTAGALIPISCISAGCAVIPERFFFFLITRSGDPGPKTRFLHELRELQHQQDVKLGRPIARKNIEAIQERRIHRRWRYVAYFLMVSVIVVAWVLIMVYGLQFDLYSTNGDNRVQKWVVASLLSSGFDFFIKEPCKIMIIASILYFFYHQHSEFDGISGDVIELLENDRQRSKTLEEDIYRPKAPTFYGRFQKREGQSWAAMTEIPELEETDESRRGAPVKPGNRDDVPRPSGFAAFPRALSVEEDIEMAVISEVDSPSASNMSNQPQSPSVSGKIDPPAKDVTRDVARDVSDSSEFVVD